jgi:Zn-dependent M28 family amino/carboxypeptidase
VRILQLAGIAAAVLALAAGALIFAVTQPVLGAGARWGGPRAEPGKLEAAVRSLVGLGKRNTHAGMEQAAAWISARLVALGLTPSDQVYRFDNENYRNVAVLLGAATPQRIVVGAHYDVAGPNPGADDNASGVAGLLEIARLLRDRPPPMRTELVFYPNEEPPAFHTSGMGSSVHARSLRAGEVRAMIGLEMIGCFSGAQQFPAAPLKLFYPERPDYIVVVGRLGDGALVRAVKRAMRGAGAPVRSINAPREVPGIDFSDHANYWNAGMPAVMITDTAFYRNPRYHTALDTPDTLDYATMAQVVEGVAAAVHALAGK